VHGILIPLPPQIDAAEVIAAIDPGKGRRRFYPLNVGRVSHGLPALAPFTPLGCIMLAKTTHAPLSGLEALVIGSSTIVGKPLAQLPHRRERDRNFGAFQDRNLPAVCRWADLLFTALGHPDSFGATGSYDNIT
jgi:methylenetetrahydrofolate dehydrogenase (NADP+)/methenyltetrahydrofolate cyclohydrolase